MTASARTPQQIKEIIISRMKDAPQTVQQIALASNVDTQTARKNLAKLEDEGIVRRSMSFYSKANKVVLCYSLGTSDEEPEMPRPPAKVVIRRDPLVAALFGQPQGIY